MGINPSDGRFGREVPFTSAAILIPDSSGDYRVLGSGVPLPITVGDGVGIDAFNRMRVSSPGAVFDSKQIYDGQPLYWDVSPSWVSVNANSIANRDIVGTNGAGGFVMASGFIPSQTRGASAEIQTALKLVADILGTSDTVLLAATGIGGTSACYGAMTWKEIT